GAGDTGIARARRADLRHLPRPPDAGHRGGRQDGENASGPPRRKPSGAARRRWRGRDHQHEPRLRGRRIDAARGRGRNAQEPVRRIELRHRDHGQESVQRAISPRGEPGSTGQLLSVREVRGWAEVSQHEARLIAILLNDVGPTNGWEFVEKYKTFFDVDVDASELKNTIYQLSKHDVICEISPENEFFAFATV